MGVGLIDLRVEESRGEERRGEERRGEERRGIWVGWLLALVRERFCQIDVLLYIATFLVLS
jgi:hypothetical protein